MKKRNEILIFFILILAIASIVYFKIIKINNINENALDNKIVPQEEKEEEKIDLIRTENSYTEEVKEILSDYDREIKNQISEQGLSDDEQARLDLLGKIIDLKERLLKLKVPTYFKALHLNLVLAFSKMESFIASQIDEERINGLRLMENAKNSQGWIE